MPSLSTAILCVTGLDKLKAQRSGFDENLPVIASLDVSPHMLGKAAPIHSNSAIELQRIFEKIRSYPGVQSVAGINVPPLSGANASVLVVRAAVGRCKSRKIRP